MAQSVTADVVLQPRDPAALSAFVAAVSDPSSPQYRQFLGPGQFATLFGPTPATLSQVTGVLSAAGLQVSAPTADNLLLPVTGTVAALEKAFNTGIQLVLLRSGASAISNTAPPSVPGTIAPAVSTVVGLDTATRARPMAIPGPPPAPGQSTSPPAVTTPGPGPQACSAAQAVSFPGGPVTATQLASAYDFNGLYARGVTGAGATVALYELENFDSASAATYESCFGLKNSINVLPQRTPGPLDPPSAESALDADNVVGLAPGASVLVYRAPNDGGPGPIDLYDQIATEDRAQVVSTSWGECEPAALQDGTTVAEKPIFAEMAAQGQTIVAAAGDSGAEDCNDPANGVVDEAPAVDDPANQPDVVAAGGTKLESLGPPPTEVVWNDGPGSPIAGGGGLSTAFPASPWQPAAIGREVPDVAADAEPSTGYVIFDQSWGVVGGTSGAAPLWAALFALADQGGGRDGLVSPALYSLGTCLAPAYHDVVQGNNDATGANNGQFVAHPGYDLASGWGTPEATNLVTDLASVGQCPTVHNVSPAAGTVAGGTTVTISGHALGGVTAVDFGPGDPGQVLSDTGTTLTVLAPQSAATATVDLRVVTAVGTSAQITADHYLYERPGAGRGYWLAAADGGVFRFGDAGFFGSTGNRQLNQPIVGMAPTLDDRGYWEVAADGGVFTFGDAKFYGSAVTLHLNQPIVGMAVTPDRKGYWLAAADGGVFAYGDAKFLGSDGQEALLHPVVGIAATPDGHGYWLVDGAGEITDFGDAGFFGPLGGLATNRPILGLMPTTDGNGYWLFSSDGGVFTFGDAGFFGSTGNRVLNRPIVAMTATPDSRGYWLTAADGGVFTFGDAGFFGSTGNRVLNRPIVAMEGS